MVAFFQHNQYHYYTADEHTLRVIQNAEALETEQDRLHRSTGRFRRRISLFSPAFCTILPSQNGSAIMKSRGSDGGKNPEEDRPFGHPS